MIEQIKGWVSDYILDDIWAKLYEVQYRYQAGSVAFTLAFIVILDTDDQMTLASKKRR
jgi:hypothetical protein